MNAGRGLRRMRAVALIAVAALLAGCAPTPDPAWTPPSWPAATVTVVDQPSALRLPEGLVGERIRNDAVGIQARWLRFPGDGALTQRMAQTVKEAVSTRSQQTGTAFAPAVFPQGTGLGDRACVVDSTLRPAADLLSDPALGPAGGTGTAIACDVVAASGTIVGERLRTVTGSPASVEADTTQVIYADTAAGDLWAGSDLWTDAAPLTLWDDVVEASRRAHGSLSTSPVQPPSDAALAAVRAGLALTVPGPGGALLFPLPAGFTAGELAQLGVPQTTATTWISVGSAVSAPLLSPFGARLVAAAGAAYQAPAAVAAGTETVDCSLFPCVALTYDDGPSELTGGILDDIAARRGSVSFFVMGEKATTYAAVLDRALAEGNIVENHTWNHPHLPTLTKEQVHAEIFDTQAAITAATGRTPTVFRPPYGEYTAEVLKTAGMAAILWDVDTFDWQGPADDVLVERAVDQPRAGSIVLQHDIQPNTGRTAGAVYDGLRDRGFTLVNLVQLFGGSLPASGAWRSGR